jgi:ABC-2 type transport system permease protein
MPDAGVRAQHQPGGVIHDLGYRGYDGPRLGRVQIVKALTWHSFRSAFGIGRGVKGKIVPVLTFIAMCLPALVNAFAVARGNARLFGYDVYTPSLRVALVTIFIAAQAPELVSRDLRSRVLPLYFCRPLRRGDYPLAKYLAMTGALLVLIEVPLLLLYVGTIASAKDGSAVWHETRALIPGLGVGLMWALLFAAIGLVLASFTGRRAYSTGIVAISCVLTFFLALLLIQPRRRALDLLAADDRLVQQIHLAVVGRAGHQRQAPNLWRPRATVHRPKQDGAIREGPSRPLRQLRG